MTRPIPLSLSLATLIAIFSALVALGLPGGHTTTAGAATQQEHAMAMAMANARFWKLGALKGMLYEHLGLTTQEVVARLQHRWAADVRISDQINRQALEMADMLSSGIVDQFGSRFRS